MAITYNTVEDFVSCSANITGAFHSVDFGAVACRSKVFEYLLMDANVSAKETDTK